MIRATLFWWGAGAVAAATADAPAHRFISIVRADAHTGRLVRGVLVAPRQVRAKPVAPRLVEPVKPGAWRSLEDYIGQTARRYDLDPALVRSVIEVESNYNPWAVSPKGARGLMQLMPQTAQRLGVRDSFNPWENIEGGVRHLRYLLALFNGDQRLALAAYNAGEGAVFRYRDIPPYRETVEYVYRVGKKMGEARKAREPQSQTAPGRASPKIVEFIDPKGRVHIQTRMTP